MKRCLALVIILTSLAGCESLDQAMSATDKALGTTGDLLNGDLRSLSATQQTTLSDIWKDWQRNEVAAKEKWSQRNLAIPGVVTRVTTTGVITGQNKIVVVFNDPTNPKCSAQAITRDDLLVNKKATNKLKKGDRVTVTGVLNSDPAMFTDNPDKCWFTIGNAQIVATP